MEMRKHLCSVLLALCLLLQTVPAVHADEFGGDGGSGLGSGLFDGGGSGSSIFDWSAEDYYGIYYVPIPDKAETYVTEKLIRIFCDTAEAECARFDSSVSNTYPLLRSYTDWYNKLVETDRRYAGKETVPMGIGVNSPLFFAWCAAKAGLGTWGDVPVIPDIEEFASCLKNSGHTRRLEEYIPFGGGHILKAGDFLLVRGSAGETARLGLVTGASNGSAVLVIAGISGRPAKITVNTSSLPYYPFLRNAEVVELRYSTRENVIFSTLQREMGLNDAAACGILSNIYHESGYDPCLYGDANTSFGLCQWHEARLLALKDWCFTRRLETATTSAQLAYLKEELSWEDYDDLTRSLRETPDTADGAREAGWQYCLLFERPTNADIKAKLRGNTAREMWFGYARLEPVKDTEEDAFPLRNTIRLFPDSKRYMEA